DDAYKVGLKVKLGPISMLYRGQVEIVERDDSARQATMRARAKEARGQGTADARVHMSIAEQSEGVAHATIGPERQLSRRAAAMGQGVSGDVAERLMEEFAGNLGSMLQAGGTNGAEPAGSEEPGAATAQTPPAPAATERSLPAGKIAG